MKISNTQAEAFRTVANAVLAALPTDPSPARSDMTECAADPARWVEELGYDAAVWAVDQAVEATADHTVNGWEDDAAREACEALYAEFGL